MIWWLICFGLAADTVLLLNRSDLNYFKKTKGSEVQVRQETRRVTPWKLIVEVPFENDAREVQKICGKEGVLCHKRKEYGSYQVGAEIIDRHLGRRLMKRIRQRYAGAVQLKKENTVSRRVYVVTFDDSYASLEDEIDQASSGSFLTSTSIVIGKSSNSAALTEDADQGETEGSGFSGSASLHMGNTQGGIGYSSIQSALEYEGELSRLFQYRLGILVDHMEESSPVTDTAVISGENYLRYSGERSAVTLGMQKITWGRVLINSSIDRLTRYNYRRPVGDGSDQRLAIPALRWELFLGQWKFDAVYTWIFQSPLLPDPNGMWSVYNQKDGTLLGQREDDGLAALIFYGDFEQEYVGGSGGGLRIERVGDLLDVGLSFQSIPWNEPYYQVNPKTVVLLEEDVPVEAVVQQTEAPTFLLDHPTSNIFSIDFGANIGKVGARLELGMADAVPVRLTDYRNALGSATLASMSLEFYPFSWNAKVNLAVSSRQLSTDAEVLDDTEVTKLVMSYEDTYYNDFWRLVVRAATNVEEEDLFLNTQMRYEGYQSTKAFLQYYLFSGSAGTLGGHYQKNSGASIGLEFIF